MKKIKTNKKMNTENSTLVTVEIPKIYTPKPQKMNRKYLSKNFFNFDISFIENETIDEIEDRFSLYQERIAPLLSKATTKHNRRVKFTAIGQGFRI